MNDTIVCPGETLAMDAGNAGTMRKRIRIAEGGNLATLDAMVLMTTKATGAVATEIPTITPDDDDPLAGTVSWPFELPDTAVGRYTIALDIDDSEGRPVVREEFDVVVAKATSLRPTGS